MTQNNRVQWVYSSQNEQELEERYDQWAEEYDADLESEYGWISPQRTSETLARVHRQGRVNPRRWAPGQAWLASAFTRWVTLI